MEEKEIQEALDKKFKDVQETLRQLQENGASKAELEKAIKAVETQGQALQDFIDSQNAAKDQTILEKFGSFLAENKNEIGEIYRKGAGEIIFNPFATKAPGDVSNASGTDAETPDPVINTVLGSFNLRNDNDLLSMASISNTSKPGLSYTELIPKEGDYAFVAEGGTKPQIDFRWENRYPKPKKAAAHEILTEEVVDDNVRMMEVAREFLQKKHDLFKANGVYFGDGTGENPTGATVYGRTFVSTGLANTFASGAATIMDVINACVTDVYRTQAFTDEEHYMPNVSLINPINFFVEFQAKKDANGLPLYPQASLFNQVTIGNMTIRPWIKVPAGKVFVADMSKYHVVNYIPFSIRIGWINDQFITNKFTMVGESRYYQYVKNLDQAAFIYDDIATVRAAIES